MQRLYSGFCDRSRNFPFDTKEDICKNGCHAFRVHFSAFCSLILVSLFESVVKKFCGIDQIWNESMKVPDGLSSLLSLHLKELQKTGISISQLNLRNSVNLTNNSPCQTGLYGSLNMCINHVIHRGKGSDCM
jgi:hypothetical protein